jgi:aspartate aminotransferase-like enzyme
MTPNTVFKIATEPDEFEQIHRLNHATFAGEIPQHAPQADGRLVDKFHAENTYLIGVREGRVIAMIALRRRRPFSLDAKLPDLDRWLPPGRRLIEMRLLSVLPAHRNGPVLAQLLLFAARHSLARGDDLAVISGALKRVPLYRAVGFEAFGPVVGAGEAWFQPMQLTLENFVRASDARRGLRGATDLPAGPARDTVNLLPGPVAVSAAVRAVFARVPVSHRAAEFLEILSCLRRRVAALAHAADVQILPGTGTLANDVVAAQLAATGRPGVVISTGEFGERLADHARRAGLEFHWARLPWGAPPTAADYEEALGQVPAPAWLWLVHHETSTGVLHDLARPKALAAQRGLTLAVDCMSSLGAVPVDLAGVQFATATSGKGLAGMPGLALVFHEQAIAPRADLPRYLDLGLWATADSVPFTHSSNLVAALDVAVAEVERLPAGRCGDGTLAADLRRELRAAGFTLGADDASASPIIVTVKLPETVRSAEIGAAMEQRGFLTSHRSGYLMTRNWIQFSLMAPPPREALVRLVAHLRDLTPKAEAA